jgi:hypothetical protein
MHAPPQPICTAAGERVLFSESPPLSGDKPPSKKSNSSCARHKDDEKLLILLGGFSLLSEYPENNRDLQSKLE